MNNRLIGRTSATARDREPSNAGVQDSKSAVADRDVFSFCESESSSTMPYPALEYASVASRRPYDRNARTHSKKQIRQIANSIERSMMAGSSPAMAASTPLGFSRSSACLSYVCRI
jgi:hypothetical protein